MIEYPVKVKLVVDDSQLKKINSIGAAAGKITARTSGASGAQGIAQAVAGMNSKEMAKVGGKLGILITVALTVASILKSILGTAMKPLNKMFGKLLKLLGMTLQPIFQLLSVLLLPLFQLIKPVALFFKTILKPYYRKAMQAMRAGNKLFAAGQTTEAVKAWAVGAGFVLKPFFDLFLRGAATVINFVLEGVKQVGYYLLQALDKVIDTLSLGQVKTNFAQGFANAIQSVQDKVQDTADGISSGVDSFLDEQLENITKTADSINNTVSDKTKDLKKKFKDTMEFLNTKFDSMSKTVSDKMVLMGKVVVDSVSAMYAAARQAEAEARRMLEQAKQAKAAVVATGPRSGVIETREGWGASYRIPEGQRGVTIGNINISVGDNGKLTAGEIASYIASEVRRR